MRGKYFLLLAVCAATNLFFSTVAANEKIKDDFVEIELIFQHESVAPNSNSAIEIKFSLAANWHFYADKNTAPQQMNLRIIPQGKGLSFSKPVFPKGYLYSDKVTGKMLEVYSHSFSVFIPFATDANNRNTEVNVAIEGLSCSQQLCRKASYELTKKLDISASARMDEPRFSVPAENNVKSDSETSQTPAKVALPLAIVAGLLLNVMPCVWPVLPIIVMRLIQQAKQSKAKSIALGFAFAAGIILFFVALAAVNVILKLGFGMVFQWGDQFRNPAFVVGMALLMVVLALYMFGLFTFGLPALISGQSGRERVGFAGSIGMGFLAAVLSTPCSFAILAFVLAWAQTQPILLATVTILLIGVGMAVPYVILTCIPGLLGKIPKPGRWMELFKHATGFILLVIGVKLLEAAPLGKIINILYYAVVLAVCVWMWGVWVGYNTPAAKKWTIRIIAILLAVAAGFTFLTESQKELIDWHQYDPQIIAAARQNQKPVLVKFTADWCFSCKILDKTVYSSAQIADLIEQKGVLAIKADTTRFDYPAAIALKEIYSEPAVPVTILLLPPNETPIKLRGNLIKEELIRQLQSLEDVKK